MKFRFYFIQQYSDNDVTHNYKANDNTESGIQQGTRIGLYSTYPLLVLKSGPPFLTVVERGRFQTS